MSNYTIFVNDTQVATTSGPDDCAQAEAFRYAQQYREEGRVTIMKGGWLVAILSQISKAQPQTPQPPG